MGKVFRRAVMDASFSIAGRKVTRGKSVKVRDSKNPKDDDNEATHEMREDGNLYDLKTGLVYLGAQDGNLITKGDEGTGTGGIEGLATAAGDVDDKAVDEALKALRTCLSRLVPAIKRKPVTVTGIRAKDAAVRNEAHWQGVTDAILESRPNASRDPGMAQYLAGR